MFSIVLRRARILIVYVGQGRRKCAVDSISKPQLQNGLRESTKPQPESSNKFDPFGIMTVKKTISRWPDKFLGYFS